MLPEVEIAFGASTEMVSEVFLEEEGKCAGWRFGEGFVVAVFGGVIDLGFLGVWGSEDGGVVVFRFAFQGYGRWRGSWRCFWM